MSMLPQAPSTLPQAPKATKEVTKSEVKMVKATSFKAYKSLCNRSYFRQNKDRVKTASSSQEGDNEVAKTYGVPDPLYARKVPAPQGFTKVHRIPDPPCTVKASSPHKDKSSYAQKRLRPEVTRWTGGVLKSRAKLWRFDLQRRTSRKRGRWVDAVLDDGAAIKEVEKDTHTATARLSITARANWWLARAKARNIAPLPLDTDKLRLAAAILKKGQYRTAEQYLYTMKKMHIQAGREWPEQYTSVLSDLRRSCKGGLGPARGAEPLAQGSVRAEYQHGVVRLLKEAILVGRSWLLREIELAALTVKDLILTEGHGCGNARINIWTSKTDTQAKGASRVLPCTCPARECPVKAVKALAADKHSQSHLVTTWDGGAVHKQVFVEALQEYARELGMAQVELITGHSMRVTGAQNLLAAGLELERIKLFGRWKSTAQMLKYLRDIAINEEILSRVLNKARASVAVETPVKACKGPRAKTRWRRFEST